ncbi:MAG TPA: hypothetical protein VF236_10580 [Gaiellaceae bacterium]
MSDLTEPVDEPRPDEPVPAAAEPVEPEDPHAEIARKNMLLGWALFGLFVLLFAGVWAVAYIYLALD